MPVRARKGKLEWRFWVNGHEYSKVTDLADTPRNRISVQRQEAEARKLVLDGRASELRLQVTPFSEAADLFLTWADGEYKTHPNTPARMRTSFATLTEFCGKRPVSGITPGDVEDYKAWRRKKHKVCEVTIRHDLHALSGFFRYAIKHNWARQNPVAGVEIPSDKDAVRIYVLTPAEEALYFATIEAMRDERLAKKHKRQARGFQDLWDIGRLMLNQGCRPEELRELEQTSVHLEVPSTDITHGKSDGAQRTLRLRLESRDILARRLQAPSRWVFPSPRSPGAHLGPAQRAHNAVLAKCGLDFVPYDLRHTFATRAADGGMPLGTLASILGHGRGNLRSVMKYVHPTQESMDREMVRLDARPGPGPVDTAKIGEETGKPGKIQ